jgi:hypothetical protein
LDIEPVKIKHAENFFFKLNKHDDETYDLFVEKGEE